MNHAITDLGSNTIRLTVYRVEEGGTFHLLFSEKEMAGLNNYIEDGRMAPEGILRACAALTRFQTALEHLGLGPMHVFATACLREIENQPQTLEALHRRTGMTVEVLSGEEEAELGCLGALHSVPMDEGWLFDIGGGSTEISRLSGGQILSAQCLPLGCLALFNGYVGKLWPRKEELRAIRHHIRKVLDQSPLPATAPGPVCGVGGTARALLKIARAELDLPDAGRTLTRDQVRQIVDLLLDKGDRARRLILRQCPDRVHTLLPGALLLLEVLDRLEGQALTVSKYGVREGYLCRRLIRATT